MSIQSEIDRISGNISDTYSALSELGAEMPEAQNSDNLEATARTVQIGGPQSDWSVNDDTDQAYIKNRTHWVENVPQEAVPETVVDGFTWNSGYGAYIDTTHDLFGTLAMWISANYPNFSFPLPVKLSVNGIEYETTFASTSGMTYIGDSSFLETGTFAEDGPQILIVSAGGTTTVAPTGDAKAIKIDVYKDEVHGIDRKYLDAVKPVKVVITAAEDGSLSSNMTYDEIYDAVITNKLSAFATRVGTFNGEAHDCNEYFALAAFPIVDTFFFGFTKTELKGYTSNGNYNIECAKVAIITIDRYNSISVSNQDKALLATPVGAYGTVGQYAVSDGTGGVTWSDGPEVPSSLSQLAEDANHRLVTDDEKAAWDGKSDFSGSYADLTDKPSAFPPASHSQGAATITAGTFAGQVAAKSDGQGPGSMLLRNSRLVSAETSPTVNGEICWMYG